MRAHICVLFFPRVRAKTCMHMRPIGVRGSSLLLLMCSTCATHVYRGCVVCVHVLCVFAHEHYAIRVFLCRHVCTLFWVSLFVSIYVRIRMCICMTWIFVMYALCMRCRSPCVSVTLRNIRACVLRPCWLASSQLCQHYQAWHRLLWNMSTLLVFTMNVLGLSHSYILKCSLCGLKCIQSAFWKHLRSRHNLRQTCKHQSGVFTKKHCLYASSTGTYMRNSLFLTHRYLLSSLAQASTLPVYASVDPVSCAYTFTHTLAKLIEACMYVFMCMCCASKWRYDSVWSYDSHAHTRAHIL